MIDRQLESHIGELLMRSHLTLAVAESCTGGLLSHLVTNVPGSSEYYLGGVTAYANDAKMHILGVQLSTLERFGAVSRETVLEMARGVRLLLHADIGISTSGIAGPGGGILEKPVGLTWIGFSLESGENALKYYWQGDRLAVKQQTARQALQILLDYLLLQFPDG
jgi:PncC family amidohydrolase